MRVALFFVLLLNINVAYCNSNSFNLPYETCISNNGKFAVCCNIYIQKNRYCNIIYDCKERKTLDTIYCTTESEIYFSNNSKYFGYIDTAFNLTIYLLETKTKIIVSKIGLLFPHLTTTFFSDSDDRFYVLNFGLLQTYTSYLLPNKLNEERFYSDWNFSDCEKNWNDFASKRRYNFSYNEEKRKAIITSENLTEDPKDYLTTKKTRVIRSFLPAKRVNGKSKKYNCEAFLTVSNTGKYLLLSYPERNKDALIINSSNFKIISRIKDVAPLGKIKNEIFKNVVFSSDDKRVITVNTKKQLCLWNVKNGKLLSRIDNTLVPKKRLSHLSIYFKYFITDKKYIVYHFFDETNYKPVTYLLDCRTLKCIKKFSISEQPYNNLYLRRNSDLGTEVSGISKKSKYVVMERIHKNLYDSVTFSSIYSYKNLKLLKKLKANDVKEMTYKRNIYYSQKKYYETKINETYIFLTPHQIIECEWSIMDFLESLKKEKTKN